MIRLLFRTLVALVGNAVGLLVAAALLDDVEVSAGSFVVAVVVFTVVTALLQPFLAVQMRRVGPSALGGVALVATFASLVVTDLVSDGFSISGVLTWIEATVIVWIVALLGSSSSRFSGCGGSSRNAATDAAVAGRACCPVDVPTVPR